MSRFALKIAQLAVGAVAAATGSRGSRRARRSEPSSRACGSSSFSRPPDRAARPARGSAPRSRDPSAAPRARSARRATCSRSSGSGGTSGISSPRVEALRSSSFTSAWQYAASATASSTRVTASQIRISTVPQPRVRPDVPPDVRVVRDAAGLLELADDLGVVGVVAEARRRARAREGGEHHLPASTRARSARRARTASSPRARAAAREVDEEPVHDLDRLLGVVDGDVDVQAEDQLAPRDVLHLVDERAVAVAGGDPLRARRG